MQKGLLMPWKEFHMASHLPHTKIILLLFIQALASWELCYHLLLQKGIRDSTENLKKKKLLLSISGKLGWFQMFHLKSVFHTWGQHGRLYQQVFGGCCLSPFAIALCQFINKPSSSVVHACKYQESSKTPSSILWKINTLFLSGWCKHRAAFFQDGDPGGRAYL